MFCNGSEATTHVEVDFETGLLASHVDKSNMGVLQLDACESCKAYAEEHGMEGAYGTNK